MKISTCIALIATLTALQLAVIPLPVQADDNETFLTGMKITPSSLNMKSRGRFVTAHINLDADFDLPDPQDVRLLYEADDNTTAEIVALKTKWDMYGNLVVKFSRKELQDVLAAHIDTFPAVVELEVAITVGENEILVYTDDIRVIKPGKYGKGRGRDGTGDNDTGKGNGHGKGPWK